MKDFLVKFSNNEISRNNKILASFVIVFNSLIVFLRIKPTIYDALVMYTSATAIILQIAALLTFNLALKKAVESDYFTGGEKAKVSKIEKIASKLSYASYTLTIMIILTWGLL